MQSKIGCFVLLMVVGAITSVHVPVTLLDETKYPPTFNSNEHEPRNDYDENYRDTLYTGIPFYLTFQVHGSNSINSHYNAINNAHPNYHRYPISHPEEYFPGIYEERIGYQVRKPDPAPKSCVAPRGLLW